MARVDGQGKYGGDGVEDLSERSGYDRMERMGANRWKWGVEKDYPALGKVGSFFWALR